MVRLSLLTGLGAVTLAFSPVAALAQSNDTTTTTADPAMNSTGTADNAAMAEPAMNTSSTTTTTVDNSMATTAMNEPMVAPANTVEPVAPEHHDFPWGLLGLLGLAGLLGRKKNDDIVVDARRDTRP